MYFPGAGQAKDGYNGQFGFTKRSPDPATIRVSRYPAGIRRIIDEYRTGS